VAAQQTRARRVPVLLVTVALALAVRVLAGAPVPAASPMAALLFSAVLLIGVAVRRADLGVVNWTGAALGVAGGVALLIVSLVGLPTIMLGPRATSATLVWWVPLVSLVAVSEELVFRGALFSALRAQRGDAVAVIVTALLFAIVHLPLYGAGAMPIDLCVGVFLGSLRVASGGVTAPAVAHVIADVGAGWIA
jgi:membrane protease YdiL (CAAX protease family)